MTYSSTAPIPQSRPAQVNPNVVQPQEEFGLKAFAELADKLQQVKDTEDVYKGIMEYNTITDNYEIEMQGKDPSEWVGGFDKLKLDKIYKGKSGTANTELKNRIMVMHQGERSKVQRAAITENSRLIKAGWGNKLTILGSNGQWGDLYAYTDKMESIGQWSPQAADIHRQEVDIMMTKVATKQAKDILGKQMFDMASSVDGTGKLIGYEGVLRKIENPEFVKQLTNMGFTTDNISGVVDGLKKMAKLGEENQIYLGNQDKNKLIDSIEVFDSEKHTPQERKQFKDELNATLRNSNIVGDDRKQWVGYLDDWENEIYKNTDPETYTKLLVQANENPKSIDITELGRKVVNGEMTSGNYKEIVNIVEGKQINKSNAEMRSRYQDILKAQLNAEMLGDADEPETQQLYMSKADQISKWFDANPDPEPEKAQKFFAQLTQENIKDGFFKKILKYTFAYQVGKVHQMDRKFKEFQRKSSDIIGGYGEPKSEEEFINIVGVLKGRDPNAMSAKQYYDKWSGKF